MWISNISFKREDCPPEKKWIRFGRIWYDHEKHRASVLVNGIHIGRWVGKPFETVSTPPYLEGDMVFSIGYEDDDGVPRKNHQWCGHIQTSENEKGIIYWGTIEVAPIGQKNSVWIPIYLEDRIMYQEESYEMDQTADSKDESEIDDPPF